MKILRIFMVLMFLAGYSFAQSDLVTLADVMSEIRMEIGIANNHMLPDSELINICNDAIYYVSVHIGGVEDTFSLITVEDSNSYPVSDSLVDIVHAYATNNDQTLEIREWVPQFYNQTGIKSGILEEGSEGDLPVAYTLWKGRINFYPTPSRTDTIYFDVYVEHRTLTDDSMTIQIDGRTDEAIKYYALYESYRYLRLFDVADWFKTKYAEEEKILKMLFSTKLEATPEGLEK